MNFINNLPYLAFQEAGNPRLNAQSINVNLFSRKAALGFIERKLRAKQGFKLATLNLDHVVKLAINPAFAQAYREHDAIVADGFPIVWLGRMNGVSIERTAGSDLIMPLIETVQAVGAKLAIIGTSKASLDNACQVLRQKFPNLAIVYTCSPTFGFDPLSVEADTIIGKLATSGATLCLIAMGAPKQEIFAAHAAERLPDVGFVSVGASIDFIAGGQKRAPLVVQKTNLEWLWRLMTNPRRLFVRYFLCALIMPVLFLQTLRQRAKPLA